VTVVTTRVLGFDGTWREVDGYCDVHWRFLCYGEMQAGVCWWCSPEARPADFDSHIEEVRKRARAKSARSAGHPVPPTDYVDENNA
jgi:hypothetical protein